uniref:Secreted protein n=1 Tax=Haemonchus contortus TaxID=6289 RepID=A0A7I4Z3T7_HAECO
MFSFITAICLLGVITVQYGQTTLLPAPSPHPLFTLPPSIEHHGFPIPHPTYRPLSPPFVPGPVWPEPFPEWLTPSPPQPEHEPYEGEPPRCGYFPHPIPPPAGRPRHPWDPESEIPELRRYVTSSIW